MKIGVFMCKVITAALGAAWFLATPGLAGAQLLPPESAQTHAGEQLPAGSNARLLFNDEFNGSSLNLRHWYRCYRYADEKSGCSNGPPLEKQWYRTANIRVGGGLLMLTARRQSVVKGYPFTSGMIQSSGADCQPPECDPPKVIPPGFKFQFGYMEMRAKFPRGAGMWPAFWLLPADGSWPPEIDAKEWQGGTPTIDYATVHWVDSHGVHQQDGTAYDTGIDLSAGYHIYGVDWQSHAVTWYFDGQPIKVFYNASVIPQKPMYIIVNLAVGGWISLPNKHTPFPATMAVNYVRVWDRKPR
jgi:beta-glucanase (GH16 family)